MIYLSLDIETTGLNPLTCDVLEVGIYLEDTNNPLPREKLPSFHKYLWKDNYRGEAYALQMNSNIFKKMLQMRKTDGIGGKGSSYDRSLIEPIALWDHFGWWVYNNKEAFPTHEGKSSIFVAAGKNAAGFDIPFLKQIPGDSPNFHRRVLDPAILYFNPKTDALPPDLQECKKRAGLSEVVSHESLDDAWDVIQLIRRKYE